MKDRNIVQHQMDLVEWFWNRGWIAFKGDAMGISFVDHAYIIAIKGNKAMVLNIQTLKSGNSKKQVDDIAREMSRFRNVAEPAEMFQDSNVITGFAVTKGWSEMWYYADPGEVALRYKDNYVPLREVTEQ